MPLLTKTLTRACYMRDGWKCRHCNNRNGLHPHHIIFRSHGGPDELWNLITVCVSCHMDGIHRRKLMIQYNTDLTGAAFNKAVTFVRVGGWKPT